MTRIYTFIQRHSLGLAAIGAILALGWGIAGAAGQVEPNAGYYRGQAVLYPYDAVFCPNDKPPEGQCVGMRGSLGFIPKSAALPSYERWCTWADAQTSTHDQMSSDIWYQWESRSVSDEDQKYVGARLCYFEDRGKPKKIRDLKLNDKP